MVVLLFALALAATGPFAFGADDTAYRASVEKWRADYETDLKSDHGWLSIAGLFWLHEGENKFGSDPTNDVVLPEGAAPAEAGVFELRTGKIIARLNPGVAATMNGKTSAQPRTSAPIARVSTTPQHADLRMTADGFGLTTSDSRLEPDPRRPP